MKPVYTGSLYSKLHQVVPWFTSGFQIRQGPDYEWKLVSILLLLYILYVTDYILKQFLQVLKSM